MTITITPPVSSSKTPSKETPTDMELKVSNVSICTDQLLLFGNEQFFGLQIVADGAMESACYELKMRIISV